MVEGVQIIDIGHSLQCLGGGSVSRFACKLENCTPAQLAPFRFTNVSIVKCAAGFIPSAELAAE